MEIWPDALMLNDAARFGWSGWKNGSGTVLSEPSNTHSVCVADIADIRHGAHDCVFPDTAERNRLAFQLPRPAIPDLMSIIGMV